MGNILIIIEEGLAQDKALVGIDLGRNHHRIRLFGIGFDMKTPIVLVDRSRDAVVFKTTRDALVSMEAIDVLDGEYEGYDCEGFLLEINATDQYGQITIDRSNIQCEDRLRQALIYCLKALNESEDWIKQASIEKLIDRLSQHQIS